MGERVNSESLDLRPFVSWDGKYLFFVSTRMEATELPDSPLTHAAIEEMLSQPANGLQDIYWVSAEVITKLGSEGTDPAPD